MKEIQLGEPKITEKKEFDSYYNDLLDVKEKLEVFIEEEEQNKSPNIKKNQIEEIKDIITSIENLEKIYENGKNKSITKKIQILIKSIIRDLKKVAKIIRTIDRYAQTMNDGIDNIQGLIEQVAKKIGKIIF